MYRARGQFLLVVMAVLMSGCGQQTDRWKAARPATTRASGIITYHGKPLEGAVIVFQPTGPGGHGASALTDNQGKFELKTFPPELGAVPGSYSVSIMKTQSPEPAEIAISPDDSEPIEVISLIPNKYGDATLSGLVAEIPNSGTNALEFALEE